MTGFCFEIAFFSFKTALANFQDNSEGGKGFHSSCYFCFKYPSDFLGAVPCADPLLKCARCDGVEIMHCEHF